MSRPSLEVADIVRSMVTPFWLAMGPPSRASSIGRYGPSPCAGLPPLEATSPNAIIVATRCRRTTRAGTAAAPNVTVRRKPRGSPRGSGRSSIPPTAM